MSERVLVGINPKTGEVTYRVEGVEGTGCTDITDILTQSNETVSVTHTHEYDATEDMPDYVENLG